MPEAPIPKAPPANAPSAIQTAPPFVAFNPANVPPSQSTYLQLNDSLFVRFVAIGAFPGTTINYRYLTPQGEIKEGRLQISPSTAVQTVQIPVAEAWLLSIIIQLTATASAGSWIHAQICIMRGQFTGNTTPIYSVIWQGYLTAQGLNGWPGTPAKEAWDGSGTPRQITGTIPAAGADISETVPANRRWQLLSFRASLATSAAVANRIPIFVISNGSTFNFEEGSSVAQTAGTTVNYHPTPGLLFYNDGAGNIVLPAPPNVILKAGYQLLTLTTNLQAADSWSAPTYDVLEWASYDI